MGLKRFSPLLFSGTCTKALFNRCLEKSLIPVLRPGQTVILDNAAIHKSKETKQLIGKAGCELLFLPPYSPDFNPIEKTFGILKNTQTIYAKRHHTGRCGMFYFIEEYLYILLLALQFTQKRTHERHK